MMKIKESETHYVPPKTNYVKRGKVQEMEERVNRVLGTIETEEIGDTTNLILAGAMVVTERLGLKGRNKESTGNKGTNKEGAKKIIEKEREL